MPDNFEGKLNEPFTLENASNLTNFQIKSFYDNYNKKITLNISVKIVIKTHEIYKMNF